MNPLWFACHSVRVRKSLLLHIQFQHLEWKGGENSHCGNWAQPHLFQHSLKARVTSWFSLRCGCRVELNPLIDIYQVCSCTRPELASAINRLMGHLLASLQAFIFVLFRIRISLAVIYEWKTLHAPKRQPGSWKGPVVRLGQLNSCLGGGFQRGTSTDIWRAKFYIAFLIHVKMWLYIYIVWSCSTIVLRSIINFSTKSYGGKSIQLALLLMQNSLVPALLLGFPLFRARSSGGHLGSVPRELSSLYLSFSECLFPLINLISRLRGFHNQG